MKLTRQGRCFQEYFSSEVTVTAVCVWGGARGEQKDPRTDPERGRKREGDSETQRERARNGEGDRWGSTLCHDSFHSGQNVPISQAAKASGAETTCGLVVSSLQLACVPRRENAVGILEPSLILLSKFMVCRWTWPLRTVSWAPSPSPGTRPAPAPALALAAAH